MGHLIQPKFVSQAYIGVPVKGYQAHVIGSLVHTGDNHRVAPGLGVIVHVPGVDPKQSDISVIFQLFGNPLINSQGFSVYLHLRNLIQLIMDDRKSRADYAAQADHHDQQRKNGDQQRFIILFLLFIFFPGFLVFTAGLFFLFLFFFALGASARAYLLRLISYIYIFCITCIIKPIIRAHYGFLPSVSLFASTFKNSHCRINNAPIIPILRPDCNLNRHVH